MNSYIKITFIILVFVIAGIVYIHYTNQNTPNTSIEEYSNEKYSNEKEVKEYTTKLEPNTFLNFKKGERFRYVVTPTDIRSIKNKEYGIIEYYVQGIERFNKTECSLIVANLTTYSNELSQANVLVKTCVDKYGNVLYVDTKPTYSSYICPNTHREGKNASDTLTEHSFTSLYFFAPWMLSLTKDFRWKCDFDIPSSSYTLSSKDNKCRIEKEIHNIKCDVSVEGKEIVNNIKCFKVLANVKITEKNDKNKEDMTIFEGKIIFWIDVDKRIVVRGIVYQKNLPVGEIELKNIYE